MQSSRSFVVVDIETSGRFNDREGITEIAAIKIEGENVCEFKTLLDPNQLITPLFKS